MEYKSKLPDIYLPARCPNKRLFSIIFIENFKDRNYRNRNYVFGLEEHIFSVMDYVHQVINIGGLSYRRYQWAYNIGGTTLSGLWEMDQRPTTKKKLVDNHSSGRVIFSKSSYIFTGWASKYFRISPNYTKDSRYYSWNILSIMKKVGFVDFSLWTEEYKNKKMLYLRPDKYAEEDSVNRQAYDFAEKKWREYFIEKFEEIEEDDFEEFFRQKGYHNAPINTKLCLNIESHSFKSPSSLKKALREHNINISHIESFHMSDYIYGCAERPVHKSVNYSGYKNIIVNRNMFEGINIEDPYLAFTSIPSNFDEVKKEITKKIKRETAILRNYKVMNKKHCYSHIDYRDFELYALIKVFEDLFKNDLEWAIDYGGRETIEIATIKGYSDYLYRIKFPTCYKRGPELHCHHFVHEQTISSYCPEFPLHNKEMLFFLYLPDHLETNSLSESEEIKLGLEKGWYERQEIQDICDNILKFIVDKEEEMGLGNKLSKKIRKEFSEGLKEKTHVQILSNS
ncbi:MAG: hypothetical protein ACTSSP_02145 [Candidatus Asgardarchaeia archaeon]